jgi:hypothetical protein
MAQEAITVCICDAPVGGYNPEWIDRNCGVSQILRQGFRFFVGD